MEKEVKTLKKLKNLDWQTFKYYIIKFILIHSTLMHNTLNIACLIHNEFKFISIYILIHNNTHSIQKC